MSTFSEKLTADLKAAMIARDEQVLGTLRLVKTELMNAKIAKMSDLDADEELAVLRKEVKKRRDSAAMYRSQGSEDRASAEEAEAEILAQYLPAAPTDEAITAFLSEQLAAFTGERTPALKGTLIKAAREHFGSSLDGQTASRLVGEILA